MSLPLRLFGDESDFALLASPSPLPVARRLQYLQQCFHLSIFFYTVVCHLLGRCISSPPLPGREGLTHHAPMLSPSLFGEVKSHHVNRHIFLSNSLHRKIFFIKLEVMVLNANP